jgi:hypothetical protein
MEMACLGFYGSCGGGGDSHDPYIYTGSLEIRNNTVGATIIEVYVVPSNASSWGLNQTSSVIRPGDILQLYDMEPGFYDVMIVWNVGPDSIYYDIPVDSLTVTTLDVD